MRFAVRSKFTVYYFSPVIEKTEELQNMHGNVLKKTYGDSKISSRIESSKRRGNGERAM